ncbi:MAG: alpha/beta fold hydrolase [Meiothermus sp.]|uniref:alpha/beta hydrolase family protein n=1 Tax=Meiothermus sp. TaxID=1955249 RepID=UPI00298F19A6|nr:alpha/beta fold hydrolase [Meiothermus sp.]MDW8482192.1 alpha/beta fold hydrolase [Meiothermus sp.]
MGWWVGLALLVLAGCGRDGAGPRLELRPSSAEPVQRYEGWLRRDVALYVEVCRPDGQGPFPTVLLVHGGQWGPTASLRALCWGWAQRGYLVVLPHLRGQGKSQGRVSLCGDEAADLPPLVRALRDHGGSERVALVGFSMGACVALKAAQGAPWVAGVAHVLGPTDLVEQLELLRSAGRLEAVARRQALVGGSPQACPRCYAERNPLAFARALEAPLLILQAGNDPLVPATQGCRLAAEREAMGRRVYRVALTQGGQPWTGPLTKRRACLGKPTGFGPLTEDHLVLYPDLGHKTTPALLALVERALAAWLE